LSVWWVFLIAGSGLVALAVGVPLFVCSSIILYLLARALRVRQENAILVALFGTIGVIVSLDIVLLVLVIGLALTL
jgi:hypothetical protein